MVTRPDPAAQAQRHFVSGGAAVVVAVLAAVVYGLLPAALLVLAGAGYIWAGITARRGQPMPTAARVLILVGGLGFAVLLIVLGVQNLMK
jgi:hypothetical protein